MKTRLLSLIIVLSVLSGLASYSPAFVPPQLPASRASEIDARLIPAPPVQGGKLVGEEAASTATAPEAPASGNDTYPNTPDTLPSPSTGGQRPTITLAPDHGYMGQSVTVSGQGVVPYPGVRVAWLTGEATLTAAVVTLDALHQYEARLSVPDDVEPGPVQICAAVTDSEMAEFACAGFTIDQAPPGSVQGQLPLGPATAATRQRRDRAGLNATLTLRNSSGAAVATTPVLADGSFDLAQVEAGTYQVTVEGEVPILYQATQATVQPGMVYAPNIQQLMMDDLGWIGPRDLECSNPADRTPPIVSVSAIEATPHGFYIALGASGSAVNVTFKAYLQEQSGTDTTLDNLTFYAHRVDGSEITMGIGDRVVEGSETSFTLTFNVSTLPEDVEWIVAKPKPVSGCGAWGSRAISIIANPMDDPLIRDGVISWNSSAQRYDFQGTLPDAVGILPLMFPDPPPELPLVGELRNQLDAGIEFEGSMELDGDVLMRILNAYALAELLSIDLFNASVDLSPLEDERIAAPTCLITCPPGVDYCIPTREPCERRLPEAGYDYGPLTLVSFADEVDVYSGIVATYWYVVTVNAGVSVGIEGDLILEGTFRPLAPQMEATLTPQIVPSLTVSLWLDILFGVVSAGADVTASIGLSLPVEIDSETDPVAKFGDPCLNLAVILNLWAEVDVLFWREHWDLWEYPLVQFRECIQTSMTRAAAARQAAQPSPPYMAAPAVASGPSGRMLAVYVENTAPDDEEPVLKVMARFRGASGSWGPPSALTDGSRVVMDPAAAFIGPGGQALVVWTENMMTRQDYVDLDDDVAAMLPSLELFYALWNGTAWGTPKRLTNNAVPDGMAALAGDAQGATLAWVRDEDGDIGTRTDWHIVVTHWSPSLASFGAIQRLDGATALAASQPSLPDGALTTGTAGLEATELRVCSTCPYTTIQAAVDAAGAGDVVKVAAGTYAGVHTRGSRTQVVYVDKDLTIRGGYAPGDWTAPDPEANPTIVDAEGLGRVLYVTGSIAPTIEGLQITGGYHASSGGGVYVNTAQAVLRDNWIFGNTSGLYGGGVYLGNSPAELTGNLIFSNTASSGASGYGGGVYLMNSDADLVNNVVRANDAGSAGGGLYLNGATARIVHDTVAANSAGDGSGVYVSSSIGASSAVLTNTIVSGHTWGLIVRSGSTAELNNELFYNAANAGGDGTLSIGRLLVNDPAYAADGYHLTGSSAAKDQGITTNVLTDIDGEPRSQGSAPDLGADEAPIATPGTCQARASSLPGVTFDSVQAAVDAASPGDTVRIAGTCTGAVERAGLMQTVYVSKTLALQGGYASGNWTVPDPEANPTILDAEGQGRVLTIIGNVSPSIEGLHITGGDASGLGGDVFGNDAGGGVYVRATGATFRNNQIAANSAYHGAGVYLETSAALLEGNSLTANTATGRGGGIYLYRETGDWPVLSSNVISGNVAQEGGGLALISREPPVSQLQAAPVATNDAWRNNVVAYNQASQNGSGIHVSLFSPNVPSPRLWHTTLAGNSGGDANGIAFVELSSPMVLTNTVIVEHQVGIEACQLCDVALHGVLWYGNAQNTGGAGSVAVTDAVTGAPGFAGDGYHLTAASAAIDRGVGNGTYDDIDGDVRPQGAAPDLGVDEYVGGTQPGVMNAQVSVDRRQGLAVLAWTVDGDGELTTNGDRRIAIAKCYQGACSVGVPARLPAGADSPSVALHGPARIHLAFLQRGKDGDGVTDTGIGNQAVVWTAEYAYHDTGYGWRATAVRDEEGLLVRGERPKLSTGGGEETLLLFRRFGPAGSNGYLGQLALTQVGANAATRAPLYLTDEPVQHWQPALAVDQLTGRAEILEVSRAPLTGADAALEAAVQSLEPASYTARPQVEAAIFSTGGDPVQSLAIEVGADPALDPVLALSQQHPTPGSTVVVTATVRNVGREPATGLAVHLYAGSPGDGTLLDSAAVPGELALNQSQAVRFQITAGSGSQPLSALVSTSSSDLSSENNTATADLSELPAPPQVHAVPSTQYAQAIQVSWLPPEVPGVAGYRILRSEVAGGPYELVGQATGLVYSDLLLEIGQPYYYVVQAFDAADIRSPYSVEVGSLLPRHEIFLPLILGGP